MIIEENSPTGVAGGPNLNSIDEARTKGEFPANFYIASAATGTQGNTNPKSKPVQTGHKRIKSDI